MDLVIGHFDIKDVVLKYRHQTVAMQHRLQKLTLKKPVSLVINYFSVSWVCMLSLYDSGCSCVECSTDKLAVSLEGTAAVLGTTTLTMEFAQISYQC